MVGRRQDNSEEILKITNGFFRVRIVFIALFFIVWPGYAVAFPGGGDHNVYIIEGVAAGIFISSIIYSGFYFSGKQILKNRMESEISALRKIMDIQESELVLVSSSARIIYANSQAELMFKALNRELEGTAFEFQLVSGETSVVNVRPGGLWKGETSEREMRVEDLQIAGDVFFVVSFRKPDAEPDELIAEKEAETQCNILDLLETIPVPAAVLRRDNLSPLFANDQGQDCFMKSYPDPVRLSKDPVMAANTIIVNSSATSRAPDSLFPASAEDLAACLEKLALEGRIEGLEIVLQGGHGHSRRITLHAVPFSMENEECLLALADDLSEPEELSREVSGAWGRTESVNSTAQAIPFGYLLSDIEGRILLQGGRLFLQEEGCASNIHFLEWLQTGQDSRAVQCDVSRLFSGFLMRVQSLPVPAAGNGGLEVIAGRSESEWLVLSSMSFLVGDRTCCLRLFWPGDRGSGEQRSRSGQDSYRGKDWTVGPAGASALSFAIS